MVLLKFDECFANEDLASTIFYNVLSSTLAI